MIQVYFSLFLPISTHRYTALSNEKFLEEIVWEWSSGTLVST